MTHMSQKAHHMMDRKVKKGSSFHLIAHQCTTKAAVQCEKECKQNLVITRWKEIVEKTYRSKTRVSRLYRLSESHAHGNCKPKTISPSHL